MKGRAITTEELDARLVGALARLRQEEYELRRETIDEIVTEELLEREAAARGISREELLDAEVEQKVEAPSAAEIDAFYEANKARIKGQSKQQVLPQIRRVLRQRQTAARRREFTRQLAADAGLRVMLTPPRLEIPIPATAPALGPADAPVTIVEFTDYQCPFCMRAQETVDRLLERYQGRLRLVYRDLPLDMHQRAFDASRAARCAGEQDHFWEYHRSLLTAPGDFSDEDFVGRARELELDLELFESCLASPRHDAAIEASLADARRFGVQATPTFFINGRMLAGAQPFEDFVDVIDEELAAAP
jgi:protein-disulfide isomerase